MKQIPRNDYFDYTIDFHVSNPEERFYPDDDKEHLNFEEVFPSNTLPLSDNFSRNLFDVTLHDEEIATMYANFTRMSNDGDAGPNATMIREDINEISNANSSWNASNTGGYYRLKLDDFSRPERLTGEQNDRIKATEELLRAGTSERKQVLDLNKIILDELATNPIKTWLFKNQLDDESLIITNFVKHIASLGKMKTAIKYESKESENLQKSLDKIFNIDLIKQLNGEIEQMNDHRRSFLLIVLDDLMKCRQIRKKDKQLKGTILIKVQEVEMIAEEMYNLIINGIDSILEHISGTARIFYSERKKHIKNIHNFLKKDNEEDLAMIQKKSYIFHDERQSYKIAFHKYYFELLSSVTTLSMIMSMPVRFSSIDRKHIHLFQKELNSLKILFHSKNRGE